MCKGVAARCRWRAGAVALAAAVFSLGIAAAGCAPPTLRLVGYLTPDGDVTTFLHGKTSDPDFGMSAVLWVQTFWRTQRHGSRRAGHRPRLENTARGRTVRQGVRGRRTPAIACRISRQEGARIEEADEVREVRGNQADVGDARSFSARAINLSSAAASGALMSTSTPRAAASCSMFFRRAASACGHEKRITAGFSSLGLSRLVAIDSSFRVSLHQF